MVPSYVPELAPTAPFHRYRALDQLFLAKPRPLGHGCTVQNVPASCSTAAPSRACPVADGDSRHGTHPSPCRGSSDFPSLASGCPLRGCGAGGPPGAEKELGIPPSASPTAPQGTKGSRHGTKEKRQDTGGLMQVFSVQKCF